VGQQRQFQFHDYFQSASRARQQRRALYRHLVLVSGTDDCRVNGNDIAGANGYDPAYDGASSGGSDASIRESNHGLFADIRLAVASSYLRAGQNTITLIMRKGGYLANHTMYDYLRLEVPGYIPPAPATAAAYAGNNCNLICWPVQPGATGYNLLRSTTSGSGYVSITNGVTGPVCGSGWNNATFLDTNVVNGTAYYYVVRAVNTAGSSTNSPEAAATPSAGIAAAAPASPTGLTVGSATHQSVTLNWNAVSNANFYTIYRSTLFNNGGGASNVLGTIVLANNVTNATYTDASPTDNSIYRYAVAATGAGGTSTNSLPAVAVPKPAPPALPAGSLYITSTINTNPAQVDTLTWNPVAGAIGYAVYFSTSSGGPYTFLQSVSTTTYSIGGLGTNQIYYYRVVALNAAGVSANANDSVNPKQAAPASLTATANTNLSITLSWPATAGATNYTVKRGTSVAGETFTVVSGYTGTSYTNSGLVNGTTYYYVVTATGSGGASGNSPEASATPFANASGIWISPVNGNWTAATNWSGGQIASGYSSTADFSTLALSGNVTVTLVTNRTISGMKFGDTAATYNWLVAGTNILTLGANPNLNVLNDAASIGVSIAGTNGFTKNGLGALVLTASNSVTGGVTVNSGSLTLDFTASNLPAANLIPTNALTLSGGALQIVGNTNSASIQNFSATTLNTGASTVAGTNNATVNLANITPNAGGVIEFIGPATVGLGGGNVAATATITTPAQGSGAFVGGGSSAFNAANFATVGLYDFAATTGGSAPYTVVGGSQISGFYTAASGAAPSGGNLDVTGNITSWSAQPYLTSMRFNSNIGANISVSASGNGSTLTLAGILVTPNIGAHNATYNSGNFRPNAASSPGNGPFVVWQNNSGGELVLNTSLGNPKYGTSAYVQSGGGTVVMNNTGNGYSDQSYLNGGVLLAAGNGSLGAQATAATLNLNGGTLAANGTFALDNAGANLRPVNLLNNGGGLAATAGNTLTVDGFVGSAAGAGPLTIGIAASAANNFTSGLLPGTGAGTANTTPVYATGTVVLTNANNYYGGTVLQSGTLNFNGIFALGGANYGGVTFNGGTLQYVTNFPGNNGSADLTATGTAGITLAAGGGTIDLNGNAVTFANSIGNNGGGSLVVKSSTAGGTLTLQAGNNYSGNTTVTNATLVANNASGSGAGSGNIFVQNAGVLSGNGAVSGSVNVLSGGKLTVGNTSDSLAVGNSLVLNAGSTTTLQIQHSPATNSSVSAVNAVTFGGALVVTNLAGTLTNGDAFPLFTANNFSGAFTSLTLPALATGLFWNTNLFYVSGTLAVATTNPPLIATFATDGTTFSVNGSGGVPAWNYVVLTATNLAAPVWTPVATNQFDTGGNFQFTNPVPAAADQRFFKLKLQ
jgi:autotransporter-associated beta strand protein